ncbi:MAG: NAD(P)H-hydrate dehydratase [Tomitella sp.]|nr:NAD(P)H-hydrate dehydratase [Tomitella sp.]
MRSYHDVDAVRAAEEPLLAALPEGVLMRRAACGLAGVAARELKSRSGGVAGRSVLLLVGSGDNGGDALFAGAALRDRGAAVTAVLLRPERAHPRALAALRVAGGRIVTADDALADHVAGSLRSALRSPDLVIDGIVGISGRPGLRPQAAELVGGLRAPVVAADLPSGIDPATGSTDGPAVRADVTVAFGALKPVHVLGAEHCGRVELVDIGLDLGEPVLLQYTDADVGWIWPVPGPHDDKYSQGVTGIVAGSRTYPGAAVLCTGAAVAATSGMVRYAGSGRADVVTAWPEVIATGTLEEAGRVQAWAAGPGMGTDDDAAARLRSLLETDHPVLVDADGLTVLADHLDWVRKRSAPTVLTPHAGEPGELTGADLPADRVGAGQRLAADLGATVLLKGYVTVIADAAGKVYVETSGHAWAATAGSGDLLTGIIGALLAAGIDSAQACAAGARVHSMAAGLAAFEGDPTGAPVSSSIIVTHLRAAIRRVRGAAERA